MISIPTRAFCAILSTIGAVGLVTFANPANSFATVRATSVPAAVANATPIATAYRG